MEQYTHTLIAKPKVFSPSASQVQNFLSVLAAQNVIPENPVIVLRILTGKMREFPNLPPELRRAMNVELTNNKNLQGIGEIADVVGSQQDYLLKVSCMGRPKLPPLVINFNEPYHLGITCRVYSNCRSTSNLHGDTDHDEKPVRYGKPCSESQLNGYFTNPHDGKTLIVPDAGCARFWIEFELGKFLVPDFTNDKLELLNPFIVTEAERIFGIKFVQGCYLS